MRRPSDIVSDGDPAPPTEKGTAASPLSRFTDAAVNRGPCLLWRNGWIVQDATWYGGRPRYRVSQPFRSLFTLNDAR